VLTVRLSLLLLRGAGGAGLLRLILLLAGSAISVIVILTLTGIPQTLAAQSDRNAARTPVAASSSSAGHGSFVVLTDHFNGVDVTRVLIAGNGSTPTPPGVASLPRPGELVLSPALAKRVNASPAWRHRFPGQQVAPIGPAGLVGANELYGYVGVTGGSLARAGVNAAIDGGRLAGFGAATELYPALSADQIRLLERVLDGLVGVPLVVFALTCLCLSAATRQWRFASLRLLGLDARRTRNVSAVESAVVTLAAVPIGIAAFYPLNSLLSRMGVAGSAWYSADSSPSAVRLVVLIIALPAIAAVLAAASSRAAVRSPLLERRPVRVPAPSAWRLVPLVVGLLVVGGLLFGEARGGGGSRTAGLAIAGGLLSGFGAVLSIPWLTARTAHLVAARVGSLSLQLGLRRLELEPSGSLRVVSGLAVLVFVACLGNGVARDVRGGQVLFGGTQQYEVRAAEVPPSARSSLLGSSGSHGVAVLQNNQTAVAFGTCAGLGALLDRPLRDCSDAGTRFGEPQGYEPALQPRQELRLDTGRGARFTVHASTHLVVITVDEGDQLGRIQALLPMSALPHDRIPEAASLMIGAPDTVAVNDAVYNRVYDVAPAADVIDGQDYTAAASTDRFAGYFALGLLLALMLGVAGFVIASADRAIERRANVAALEVVGVPHRTLLLSQALQLAIPLALGATVALTTGLLTEQAYLIAGGQDTTWAWRSIVTDIAVALLAVVAAGAGATLAVGRRPDVSMLRRD